MKDALTRSKALDTNASASVQKEAKPNVSDHGHVTHYLVEQGSRGAHDMKQEHKPGVVAK